MNDSSTISVHPVIDADATEAFFKVPRDVLGQLDGWRPPPEAWERRLFDPSKNPLYDRAEIVRYVAERDSTVVGRIVAWVDDQQPDRGFFGFFDVRDDTEAGKALAATARDFCRSRGRETLCGPIDFWPVCSAGVLVEGFERHNYIGMHHGAPHYAEILTEAGFEPSADLYAWSITDQPLPPPALGIEKALRQNERLAIRSFDPTDRADWEIASQLYERCYGDDPWYAPCSADELKLIAAGLVEPTISMIATVDDQPAGFAVGLKNAAESSVRVGPVIPPETVQRMLRPGRKPRSWRQWLFGVAPEYRGNAVGGLGTALWVRVRRLATDADYRRGEATWSQAIDDHVGNSLLLLGARRDKTYRLFVRGPG